MQEIKRPNQINTLQDILSHVRNTEKEKSSFLTCSSVFTNRLSVLNWSYHLYLAKTVREIKRMDKYRSDSGVHNFLGLLALAYNLNYQSVCEQFQKLPTVIMEAVITCDIIRFADERKLYTLPCGSNNTCFSSKVLGSFVEIA